MNKRLLLAVPFPFILVIGQMLCMTMGWRAEAFAMAFCGGGLVYMAFLSKSRMLIVSAIFCSSYFLFLLPYFFNGIKYATRENYQELSAEAINVFYLTSFTTVFFVSWFIKREQSFSFPERIRMRNNPYIYWFCVFVIVVFSCLVVDPRGTILTLHYREVTATRYGFIDYSLVFTLMAYIFSGSKKLKQKILITVCVFYIVINLLYGLRLRSIQMLLLLFMLFFENRVSPKQTLWLSIMGLFGLQFIGMYRVTAGFDGIYSFFGGGRNAMVSNQGGVFLTANMYIGLVSDGLITMEQRVTTLLGNIASILYSQNALPDDYNIAKLAKNYFTTPGGGLVSGYMYVWGGLFGLVFGTWAITAVYIKAYSRNCGEYFLVYGALIIVIIPRWFAYSPLHFVKMGLWCVFIFAIFSVVDRWMKKHA